MAELLARARTCPPALRGDLIGLAVRLSRTSAKIVTAHARFTVTRRHIVVVEHYENGVFVSRKEHIQEFPPLKPMGEGGPLGV